MAQTPARPWWRDTVIYRVDVRSFRDSNSDGVGDIDGLRERIGYLDLLGVDSIWLTAFLSASYGGRGKIDPVLGDLESFAALVDQAHASGIRVSIDVPFRQEEFDQPGTEQELARTLRFWADHGVDAFRVGITPGMSEPSGADVSRLVSMARPVVDEYPDRILSGYVDERIGHYAGLQELTIATDIRFSRFEFDAEQIRRTIDEILATFQSLDVPLTWFLASWVLPRPVTRFGMGKKGLARARAIALVQLALPGIIGVDNGDELGLSEYQESGGHYTRGVMPWEANDPTLGFTDATTATPPAPDHWTRFTVAAQLEDPDSTLSLYRRAIDLRRRRISGIDDTIEWYGAPEGCLAFRLRNAGITCALNTTGEPVMLPPGEVLLASEPITDNQLPANAAAWLA